MNVIVTGQHVEVTPAIREYVVGKMLRIARHFDHPIDVNVVLSVEKIRHHIEANVHLQGKDLFVECTHEDMYASIDELADMLDRTVIKHKEKRGNLRHAEPIKRMAAE